MSFGVLIWLFFIFSAIQPMLQQKMLEAMRMRKILQLERERKSRVILLVHRQETMRLLGFPVARYIDINDSEEGLGDIQMNDDDGPLAGRAGTCRAADRESDRSTQGQGYGLRTPLCHVGRHADRARGR